MGTWGTGPFDSDVAGDFVDGLAGTAPDQVVHVLQQALHRVVGSGARVDGGDAAEAVAAAALIAAQVPASDIALDPEDGPEGPLPELPHSLRPLAREALHHVLDDESELAQGWVDNTDAAEWRQELQLILRALK